LFYLNHFSSLALLPYSSAMPTNTPNLQHVVLHTAAPDKPGAGEPCNGCGVCCAAEPCVLARWILLQAEGRCRALCWLEGEKRYRCGLVTAPQKYRPWLSPVARPAARLFRRWIAAGAGCDSDAEVVERQER